MQRWRTAPTNAFVFLLLALIVLPAIPVRADLSDRLNTAVRSANLGQAQVAVCVADLDQHTLLAAIKADASLIPASNMKLVTAAAALDKLGPDFAFTTELRLLATEAGGDTLAVIGDGDPGFGDPRLLEAHRLGVEDLLALWVKAVKDAGVTRVARLIIDDRVFDQQRVHPTWPERQLNAWFCAQVSGLNFYDNCLDVWAQPGPMGGPAKVVYAPALTSLRFRNDTVTARTDNFMLTRHPNRNEFVASGRVRTASRQPVAITVEDPAIFFAQVLSERLAQAGIPVVVIARPGADEKLPQGRTLHVVRTTMPAVLERCLKNSQNLFAESLLKRTGRAATHSPGSWANGSAAVRGYLADKLGTRATGAAVVDGSGMSRDNRVTARLLVEVLATMHQDPKLGPLYRDSLAIAGKDGTLEDRLNTGLVGTVYAKSGYLDGVSSLSGYIVMSAPPGSAPGPASAPGSAPAPGATPKPPRTVAFSILINGFKYPTTNLDAKSLQDEIVRQIEASIRE